jgi:putative RNA 2'-phosphotransferase
MTAGISMDEAGWSSRVEVIRVLGCSEAELDAAILHNDKGRFEAFGEFIRAVQGHDLEGTPVALAALEASWVRLDPVGLLYHATRADVADEIAQGGVLARGRTHVHLAAAPDKVATTSGRDEVLIVIDAERLAGYGLDIFRAANGVVLVREVPPGAIVEVRTQGHE